jgi:hypothetical protein
MIRVAVLRGPVRIVPAVDALPHAGHMILEELGNARIR